ncbi:hypothetical protein [Pedobacter sp. MW01-1-1]|uniref:hypothetical protein n=1 Tax=Pedobacter sp. MW01-1-1 TaxID=3383027 RepID=UPI003FED83E2
MRKFVFTILGCVALLAASVNGAKAQNYKNAIGGRFGSANGVTFKTTLGGNKMLDAILNFRSRDDYSYFRLTGLYEINNEINGLNGLFWYYGVGASLGSVKYKPTNHSDLYASIDGVIGLDYKIEELPINLSLDWKPALELTPDTGFDAAGLGLSIRFTF